MNQQINEFTQRMIQQNNHQRQQLNISFPSVSNDVQPSNNTISEEISSPPKKFTFKKIQKK